MDVAALIAKARAHTETVRPVDQEVLFGDEVATVRFWPVSGPEWRLLTAKHPARTEFVYDLRLGYDLDAVVRDHPKVYLVQGDDVTPLVSIDDSGKTVSKFPEILDVLSGYELKTLAMVVWGMQEYEPEKRLSAAGKASKGGQRKKRSSPAN